MRKDWKEPEEREKEKSFVNIIIQVYIASEYFLLTCLLLDITSDCSFNNLADFSSSHNLQTQRLNPSQSTPAYTGASITSLFALLHVAGQLGATHIALQFKTTPTIIPTWRVNKIRDLLTIYKILHP